MRIPTSLETVRKIRFPHLNPDHNEHKQACANKSWRDCFCTRN